MIARRVLFILLLLVTTILTPIVASACPRGQMCWPGGGRGYYGGYNRQHGTWYDRHGYYGRYNHQHNQVVVVERRDPNIVVEREPGLIDYALKPVGFALGLIFGRTRMVDTSCPNNDVACHRAKGREDGRYDGKSAVADATEDSSYREAYNDEIRNSGHTVEPAASPSLYEGDIEPEE